MVNGDDSDDRNNYFDFRDDNDSKGDYDGDDDYRYNDGNKKINDKVN